MTNFFIEQLQGIQATVEPSIVNLQNTKLQMFGSIVSDLEKGDYFLITLPNQVSVRYTQNLDGASGNILKCVFLEPSGLPVERCESLSSQIIKITVGARLSYYFQFDVL